MAPNPEPKPVSGSATPSTASHLELVGPPTPVLPEVSWDEGKYGPDNLESILSAGGVEAPGVPPATSPPTREVTDWGFGDTNAPERPDAAQTSVIPVHGQEEEVPVSVHRSAPRPVQAVRRVVHGEQPITEPKSDDTEDWPNGWPTRSGMETPSEIAQNIQKNYDEQKRQRTESERQQVAERREQRRQERARDIHETRLAIGRVEKKVDDALESLKQKIDSKLDEIAPKIDQAMKNAGKETWRATKAGASKTHEVWKNRQAEKRAEKEARKKAEEDADRLVAEARRRRLESSAVHGRRGSSPPGGRPSSRSGGSHAEGRSRAGGDGTDYEKYLSGSTDKKPLSPEKLAEWLANREKHSDPSDPYYYAYHAVEINDENYARYVERNEPMPPIDRKAWEAWQKELAARTGELSSPPGEEDDDDEPEPISLDTARERLSSAESEMLAARSALVDLTIRRSGRMDDRWRGHRRQDKEAYEKAMATYKEKLAEYMRAKGAVMELEHDDWDEKEINKQLLLLRYEEKMAFKNAEKDRNEELYDSVVAAGGAKAKLARFLRWYSRRSPVTRIIIGAGIGGGAFLLTGPLGLGAGVAIAATGAKFSLGVLNRTASARNRVEQSVAHELRKIEKELKRSLLAFESDPELDREKLISGGAASHSKELDKDIKKRQRRNRIGNVLMALGAGAAAYGAADALADHWPLGWPFHGGPSGPNLSHFHPNSFRGPNGNAAVWHAFGVIKDNHIQVHGLTPDKVHAINADLAARHFQVASGMGPGGHQNVVDWTTGNFSNARASDLEGMVRGPDGTTLGGWREFMDVARSHGVTFSGGNLS